MSKPAASSMVGSVGSMGRVGPKITTPHEDWCLPEELHVEKQKFLITNSEFLKTHVNAAEALLNGGAMIGSGRQNGKKKNKKDNQLAKVVGNEVSPPWMKQMSTRAVEINTVETLPSQAFFTSTGVGAVFQAGFFTISTINDFASYSAIFDQYRIHLIEVLIEPIVTEVTAPGGDVGEYISVVDVDDANTPTSMADLGSYTDICQSKGNVSHYHRWVPSVAVAVYSGAFTSFAASTSLWLDCASSTIQHYGIKAGAPLVAVGQTYSIQTRLHCMWRARH